MAVTITKTKAKEVKPQVIEKVEVEVAEGASLEELSIEELADRYGSLEDQVNAIMQRPEFAQLQLVKAELNKRIEAQLESEDTAEIKGKHWLLDIGACRKNSRALFPDAILKLEKFVGKETFLSIAKVNISDIDKYLTPSQVEQVVNSDTGYSKVRKIAAKFIG